MDEESNRFIFFRIWKGKVLYVGYKMFGVKRIGFCALMFNLRYLIKLSSERRTGEKKLVGILWGKSDVI